MIEVPLEVLRDLFEAADRMKLSLQEAPVDFITDGETPAKARLEEKAWRSEWKNASNKIASVKRKFYGE